jgi:amino acid transporter
MSLFRTKPIESLAQADLEGGLKRVLGPGNLVALGIGAIIGTGIFVLTGQAAAAHAGPAIVISMVLAGVVSALAGPCYAELASTVPIAGSAYTYSYATLGEFVAWVIGWDLVLEYALGAATVAVGWSGYLVRVLADFGIAFPGIISAAPGTVLVAADGSILAGLTSTMVVQMMAQPRIFMAMSRDRLLPAWMGRVHPRFGTPHLTTIATGAVVALAAGLTPIDVLGHMVSIGTLFAFVVVSAGVVVLRRTHPDLPRPFKAPWSPVVPVLSAVVSLALMLSLPGETWTRLFVGMALGVAIYFSYRYKRSRLAQGRQPA